MRPISLLHLRKTRQPTRGGAGGFPLRVLFPTPPLFFAPKVMRWSRPFRKNLVLSCRGACEPEVASSAFPGHAELSGRKESRSLGHRAGLVACSGAGMGVCEPRKARLRCRHSRLCATHGVRLESRRRLVRLDRRRMVGQTLLVLPSYRLVVGSARKSLARDKRCRMKAACFRERPRRCAEGRRLHPSTGEHRAAGGFPPFEPSCDVASSGRCF